ncbi:GAP family protein [Streptomyces sp. bgisy034]|uniref:GAP family protein n=1 Tax=Streptomyces sp. bgisy034 TaxID=3413774 RepID=UPI003EB8CEFA
MGSVTGDIAPAALGIALSPFPVVPAILLLLAPRPAAAGGAFLAGWTAGIATAAFLFTKLASAARIPAEPPSWASWARIGLGVLLLLVAVRRWCTRGERTDPAWMRALDRATWGRALRLGLLLSAANPKILLLAAAGGMSIASAALTTWGTITAVAVFTLIGSSTVALPPLLRVLVGVRILGPLHEAKAWLRTHNTTIVVLVITVVGLVLIANGVGGL